MPVAQQNARIGVDIGGTFTDVVLEARGRQVTAKVLTTHDAPARAVLDAVRTVTGEAGSNPATSAPSSTARRSPPTR